MTNISKLLISNGALCSTKEDPRNNWEYLAMPKSQQKQERHARQTLKDFLRIILNAFRMP